MEIKSFAAKFTLDGIDEEEGKFGGYASVWDVQDSYGDIVERGAFKKTLKENKQFPMLWSHDVFQPMGIIKATEDDKGLAVEGFLNMDVQLAREKRSLMVQKAINGLSIGFQTIKDRIDAAARRLKEVRLFEISPCVFQACPGSLIDEVKSLPGLITDMLTRIRRSSGTEIDDETKALLYPARLSINALLGGWEPKATPAPIEPLPSDKSDVLRLLDNYSRIMEQARKSL